MPAEINSLIFLNFDYNEIAFIEANTFQEMKTLLTLSISSNWMTNVTREVFYFQFKLNLLNLSHNQKEFIELN